MLKLNEEKYQDFKHDFLDTLEDYEYEEEDIYHYDDHSNAEVKQGVRSLYYFEKAGMEIKLSVDKMPKLEKHEGVGKHGEQLASYEQVEGEFMYKVLIKVKDPNGNWVDSSAFEDML